MEKVEEGGGGEDIRCIMYIKLDVKSLKIILHLHLRTSFSAFSQFCILASIYCCSARFLSSFINAHYITNVQGSFEEEKRTKPSAMRSGGGSTRNSLHPTTLSLKRHPASAPPLRFQCQACRVRGTDACYPCIVGLAVFWVHRLHLRHSICPENVMF